MNTSHNNEPNTVEKVKKTPQVSCEQKWLIGCLPQDSIDETALSTLNSRCLPTKKDRHTPRENLGRRIRSTCRFDAEW